MKRKNMKTLQRVASWLLTLFLLAGEMGGTGLAVYAADDDDAVFIDAEEETPEAAEEEDADGLGKGGIGITLKVVKINGVQVKSGDSGTGWNYKDGILTLDNFNLTDTTAINGKSTLYNQVYGIYSNGALTISVNGTCEINMDGKDGEAFYGIYTEGNLTINNKTYSSEGTLTINGALTSYGGAGIYCGGDLTIATAKRKRVLSPKGGMILKPGSLKVNSTGTYNNNTAAVTTAGIQVVGNVDINGAEVMANANTNTTGNNSAVEVEGDLTMIGGALTAESCEPSANHFAVAVNVGGSVTTSYSSTLKACARDVMTYPGNYVGLYTGADIRIEGAAVLEAYGTSKKGIAVQTTKDHNFTIGEDVYIVTPDEGTIGEWQIYKTVLDNEGEYASKVQIKKGTPYDVWLGSTRIDSENCNDLTGVVTGTSASYNAATNTLTLVAVSGVNGNHKLGDETGLIVAKQPLTIMGLLVAMDAKDAADHVVLMDDNADLTLLGLLMQFTSKKSAVKTLGNSKLLVDNSVTALGLTSTEDHGADLGGGLIVKAGGIVVKGEEDGIHSESGTVELQGGRISSTSGASGTTYAIYAEKINYDEGTTVIEKPENATKYEELGHEIILDKDGYAAKEVVLSSSLKPIDDLSQSNITYGEVLPDPEWTKHEGTATFSYEGILLKDGSSYGPTSDKPTAAGSYIVTVTEVKDENTYRGRQTFEILPKTLTVKADPDPAEVVYTGDAYVKLKNIELDGVVGSDDVALEDTEIYGVMADENVGVDKPVNKIDFMGATLIGEDAGNYLLDDTLTGVKVTVIKETISDREEETPVEEGQAYSQDLTYDLVEDASFGAITYLDGEDQLEVAASFTGNTLSWKMKSELTKNVVMEIKVNGGTNHNDYKVILTLKIPHICKDYLEAVEEEPTCTDPGCKLIYKCQNCGELYKDADATEKITDPSPYVIPALGHDWDNGVITDPPTRSHIGEKTYTCKRCGDTDTDPAYYVHSGLDPVPENLDSVTELYLVQGQKFTLSANWVVVNKKDKRFLAVNKKTGVVNAKKVTSAAVTISHNSGRTIDVNISKPTLTKKLKLNAGETQALSLTADSHLDVYWYSAKPDVATVDQSGKVTGVSKGSVKITAYIGGKAYNCSVSVKEPAVSDNRTLHMNVGTSKTLSLKGIKEWKSADDTIATTKNKKGVNTKKITTVSQGDVQLTASANGVEYTVELTVENITLKNTELKTAKGKNKYTLEMNVDDVLPLNFAYVQQDLLFKSSKPDIAFANENGVIEARAAGKSKITTKINGKTVTVTVIVK
ncbi:MAG: Ig-like domain-containing protein [Lachnospiraceae bacterium]|nr:Ig-like domain-containing protein [Lachnospiraceae bacterium]